MPVEPERHRTLYGYVDDVASANPTPGGGSVAAVVGALAAALGEMVANLTLDAEKFAGVRAELAPARDQLMRLREGLLELSAADEAAYGSYRRAASLPRDTEAKKAARTVAMQEALIVSTEVPLQVARAATEVAQTLETVARVGNPHLRSDAALGALLAEVALRSALLNVRGNAALVRDTTRAGTFVSEADRLEEQGRKSANAAYHLATSSAPRP
jgi:formiminotetrahydrofolate cyclodeaminase